MREIAQLLLFDRHARLVIYLRDDKTGIPFPNRWDFFGGHLEVGEAPEQALVRELDEELGLKLTGFAFFRRYQCLTGDAYPNVKHIYHAQIDRAADELVLHEGQRLMAINAEERAAISFANILGAILDDFVRFGLWPAPVDNSRNHRDAK
jgi:8-oxo-dGTP diphosphatase